MKEMCTFQPYITGCLQLISEPLPWGGEIDLQEARVDEFKFNSSEGNRNQGESNAVQFGDKPAAALLTVAVEKAS